MNRTAIGKLGHHGAFGWALSCARRARGAPILDGAVLNCAMGSIWPAAVEERGVNRIRFSRSQNGFSILIVNEGLLACEESRADPGSVCSQSEHCGKTSTIRNATCGNNGSWRNCVNDRRYQGHRSYL